MKRKHPLAHLVNVPLTLLISLLIVFSVEAQATPTPEPLVTLRTGTSYTLRAAGRRYIVRVPVTLRTGVPSIKVIPSIVDVGFEGRHDPDLIAAFKPSMEKSMPNRAPALLIQVDLDKAQIQGTYDLLLEFTITKETKPPVSSLTQRRKLIKATTNKATTRKRTTKNPTPNTEPKPQSLSLQVIHPAARLWTPGTLVIEQIQPYFSVGQTADNPMWIEDIQPFVGRRVDRGKPLTLREISKKSRLTNIAIRQLDIPTENNQPTVEHIEFPTPAPTTASAPSTTVNPEVAFTPSPTQGRYVAADHTERARPSLSGSFPLGVTKGTVEVSAAQLADALVVPFEVRARRPRSLIIYVMILGLFMGYLLRRKLKDSIELSEAKLKGVDVLARLEQERQRRHDVKFRISLQAIEQSLRDSLNLETVNDVTTNVNKAITDFNDALLQLKTRHDEVETLRKGLEELSKTRWMLPDAMTVLLQAVGPEVDTAHPELEIDNVEGARAKLEQTKGNLTQKLQTSIADWRTLLSNQLGWLAQPDAYLPNSVVTRLTPGLNAIQTLLAELSIPELDAPPEAIKATLRSIHKIRSILRDLLNSASFWLEQSETNVRLILNQPAALPLPNPAALSHLQTEITRTTEKLSWQAAHPEELLQQLENDLPALGATWQHALLGQIPQATGHESEKARQLFEERQYTDAARQIVQILKSRSKSGGKILGSTDSQAMTDAVAESFEHTWVTRDEEAVVPLFSSPPTRVVGPPPPEVLRHRITADLASMRYLRLILTGLLTIWVGYMLFADKFVGTIPDMAAVFFWAFGIDITVEALVQAAQGIKRT